MQAFCLMQNMYDPSYMMAFLCQRWVSDDVHDETDTGAGGIILFD